MKSRIQNTQVDRRQNGGGEAFRRTVVGKQLNDPGPRANPWELTAFPGRTWSTPRAVHGAGCVRPHLLSFGPPVPPPAGGGPRPSGGGGGLVLSGGRLCVENRTGLYLWHNQDGMADHIGTGDGSEWARPWPRLKNGRMGGGALLRVPRMHRKRRCPAVARGARRGGVVSPLV